MAYGPSTLLLITYVSKRSALLLLSITAGVFWLLSVLFNSIIWWAIPPARDTQGFTLFIGTVCQELARIVMCTLFAKLDRIIDKGTRPKIVSNNVDIPPKVFNDLAASISMGLGFGMVHTIFWYGAVFSTAGAPAAWYRDTCPAINAHAQSAGTAFLLSMLHIFLNIITLEAYRNIRNPRFKLLIFVPFVLYLCHSLANLMNQSSAACPAVIPVQAVILIVAAGITWFIVYRHDYFANMQMIRWEEAWRTIFSRGLDEYGRLMGNVSIDYLDEKRPHSTSVRTTRSGVVQELTRRRNDNES